MTTDTGGSAATNQDAGSAGATQTSDDDAAGSGKADDGQSSNDGKPISREDHQRAIDDMLRFKAKSKDQEKLLATLTEEVKALKKAGEKPDDWKAKAERAEAEAIEARAKADKLLNAVVTSQRMQAVMPELVKAGFRDDARNLLDHLDEDFDKLEVEQTTAGRFMVHGVGEFVESVRRKYGYAFGGKSTRVNGGGGGGNGAGNNGAVSASTINDLEQKLRKDGKWNTPDGKREYADANRKFRESRLASK